MPFEKQSGVGFLPQDHILFSRLWTVPSGLVPRVSCLIASSLSIITNFFCNPCWGLLFFFSSCLLHPFYCFPLYHCTDHWGRVSYLSLLFFGTLHSYGDIFPFLLCFLLIFFPQLFMRLPQPFWLFAFLFLVDGLAPGLLWGVTNLRP